MNDQKQPTISIVLATHNRLDVVRNTLAKLTNCGLARDEYEIIAVDNQSTDGTPEAIRDRVDVLIPLRRNAGSCAKSYGVSKARSPYILFLDDDSYPQPGSLSRMMEHFQNDPQLGAAGFQVHLPDGRLEGGALPDIFLGCGIGFRTQALREAGGLDRSFFMQAEEYDLTFRLVNAGWKVKMFDDLHVDHLKTVQARKNERTTFYDIRNNLRVLARYMPNEYYKIYLQDCLQRYYWLAKKENHDQAYTRGVRAGKWRCVIERKLYRQRRLSPQSFEHFYRWNFLQQRMQTLFDQGMRRVVFADLGKNIYAFYQASMNTGLIVQCIGDDRFAAHGRKYRGIPIVDLQLALGKPSDAIIVSNSAGVFANVTTNLLQTITAIPVHNWLGGAISNGNDGFRSPPGRPNTDTMDKGKLQTVRE